MMTVILASFLYILSVEKKVFVTRRKVDRKSLKEDSYRLISSSRDDSLIDDNNLLKEFTNSDTILATDEEVISEKQFVDKTLSCLNVNKGFEYPLIIHNLKKTYDGNEGNEKEGKIAGKFVVKYLF